MSMDAAELLIADHEKLKALLKELIDTAPRPQNKRQKLLKEIERELKIHTAIEEDIFYPAFKKAGNSEHYLLFLEAFEEHRVVSKLVLPDLKKTDPTSEKFSEQAKFLKELIEHHANEEENVMFEKAKKSLSADELKVLGERMNQRKKELQRNS